MTESPAAPSTPPADRRCPVCGARVAQRAQTCLMCGADLAAAPPQLSLITPRRSIPWVPIIIAAAVFGVVLAGGGLLLARILSTSAEATPVVAVTSPFTDTSTPAPSPTRTQTPTPVATATWTPTPIPSPTVPPPIRYTVQPGDTLLDLALRFGVSVDAIMALNGLTDSTLIAGQELLIPVPTPTPTTGPSPTLAPGTAPPGATIHEVQPGETLSQIAEQYGVPMQAIQDANSITDPDSIRPGDQLIIPLSTPTPLPPPTGGPTATPTEAPQYQAPALLAPADGAGFVVNPQANELPADSAIVLQWVSVGLLGTDPPDPFNEWYRVTLRDTSTGAVQYYFTRATALRVGLELRPPPGRLDVFEWEVQVVREIGRLPDGTIQSDAVGKPSRTRTFRWEGPAPTPAP